jgi:hypothetical protein
MTPDERFDEWWESVDYITESQKGMMSMFRRVGESAFLAGLQAGREECAASKWRTDMENAPRDVDTLYRHKHGKVVIGTVREIHGRFYVVDNELHIIIEFKQAIAFALINTKEVEG